MISPETAKYHVSEILSKLNVPTREAAAAWQPAARPFSLGRALIAAASLGTLAAVIAGLALLSWGVLRTGDGDGNDVARQSTPPAPAGNVTFWRDSDEILVGSVFGLDWFLVRPDGSDLRRLDLPVEDPTHTGSPGHLHPMANGSRGSRGEAASAISAHSTSAAQTEAISGQSQAS